MINIEDNYKLVWDVIHKHFNGGKSYKFLGFDEDDLYQIGIIGLMKAIKDYDSSKDVKFSTYAYTKIYFTILTEVNNSGRLVKFPRIVNDIVINIIKQKKKDTITIDEIANEFSIDKEYASMVMTRLHYNSISGSTPLDGEDEELELMDSIADDELNVENQIVSSVELEQRLSILSRRERNIMLMSLSGSTQREIAKKEGITQIQVSRLIKRSIEKINNKFNSEVV